MFLGTHNETSRHSAPTANPSKVAGSYILDYAQNDACETCNILVALKLQGELGEEEI